MARLWNMADDEDRKGIAQNLIEEVVVHLDLRRIESFKLKPWADRFLILRMELYRDECPELAEGVEANLAESEPPPADEEQGNHMPHRGLCVRGFQHLVDAIDYGMLLMYVGQKTPDFPLTDHTPSKHERNRRIRARYARGETVVSLAEAFDISQQRVSQILRGKRK